MSAGIHRAVKIDLYEINFFPNMLELYRKKKFNSDQFGVNILKVIDRALLFFIDNNFRSFLLFKSKTIELSETILVECLHKTVTFYWISDF